MFEVVIPFRPRQSWDSIPDLLRVVDSLTAPYVISHYGGQVDSRLNGLNVVYTETGSVWNRSKALNIGAASVTTDYVMPNDADCVWEEDMIEPISSVFTEGMAPSLGVLYNGKINKTGYGMTGWNKQWPVEWDERYRGYGREDIDFKAQLERAGIGIKRIEYGVIHLDHTPENHHKLWKENMELFGKKWGQDE